MALYFDLRFIFLIIINIVKSQTWEWDPFHVANDPSWTKFWLLAILLFIFSFVFIGVPLLSSNNNSNISYIHIHLKNFSTSLLVCFLASLLSPQVLFWYLYPVILLLSLCHTRVSNMLSSFVFWLQTMLSVLPAISIFVTAADIVVVEANEELEIANLEEGVLNG